LKTRPKNRNAHPGAIDAARPKRSAEEMAEFNSRKAADAKVIAEKQAATVKKIRELEELKKSQTVERKQPRPRKIVARGSESPMEVNRSDDGDDAQSDSRGFNANDNPKASSRSGEHRYLAALIKSLLYLPFM
jgi:hypothetical protein